MGLQEGFYWAIDHVMEKFNGNKLKVSEFCGLKWATFYGMLNRTTQSPGMDKLVCVIDKLEDKEFIEFVRKMRPHISWAMAEPGYREVKTYNIIGCKHIDDLEKPDQFGKDRKLFTLRIPEKFFPSDFAVLFSGSSMNNIIPDKAAAGVTKDFDFRPGEVYLCELPVEGLTFKRVIFHPAKNGLEFKADTKIDPESIPSHFYHVDEGEKYIVGRLTWVAHRK